MRKDTKILAIATSVLILLTMSVGKASAQYTGIEIHPDTYTVVLDHLNGATVGEPRGTLNYVTSLPGLDLSGDFTADTYTIYRASVNLESQGTVELWIKPRTYGVGLMDFNWGYTYSYPPAGHVLQLTLLSDGRIKYLVWNPGCEDPEYPGYPTMYSNSAIQLNEWTHVAVSWGPAGSKIYINGSVDASTLQCIRPSASWGVWVYLHFWGASDLGYVDELHISSIQRTDDEIRSRITSLVKEVAVDIKPGSDPNSINPRSKGRIPVAILTTDTFDATTVDPATVRFGATGTEAAPVHSALEDVDGDGDTDLILHFSTQDTGIACGDISAFLTGETVSGQTIEGSDSINTVGCK